MKILKKLLVLGTLVLIWYSSVFAATSISSSNSSNSTSSAWNWSNCIKLNTDIPWLSKNNCIKPDDAWNAFWKVMWGLMKLAINFTVAIAFISLIASGIMLSISWLDQSIAWKWKVLLKKVILWIVLLWLSWIILHTINPNFFKTDIYFVLINNL